ncbi:hypothetical protein ACJMK2_032535 [Sinanodonta woodiana]|uniref:C2H2-type domain-containing protein n=1 Tax=Sinanodonta woodiana TaxID=1069815 RepID=A0ABD3X2L8_SINWO
MATKQSSYSEIFLNGRKKYQCLICSRIVCSKHSILHHLNGIHSLSPVKRIYKLHVYDKSIKIPARTASRWKKNRSTDLATSCKESDNLSLEYADKNVSSLERSLTHPTAGSSVSPDDAAADVCYIDDDTCSSVSTCNSNESEASSVQSNDSVTSNVESSDNFSDVVTNTCQLKTYTNCDMYDNVFQYNLDEFRCSFENCGGLWPIFMVINELRPKARFSRDNMLLAGIWQGKENQLLNRMTSFSEEMNRKGTSQCDPYKIVETQYPLHNSQENLQNMQNATAKNRIKGFQGLSGLALLQSFG